MLIHIYFFFLTFFLFSFSVSVLSQGVSPFSAITPTGFQPSKMITIDTSVLQNIVSAEYKILSDCDANKYTSDLSSAVSIGDISSSTVVTLDNSKVNNKVVCLKYTDNVNKVLYIESEKIRNIISAPTISLTSFAPGVVASSKEIIVTFSDPSGANAIGTYKILDSCDESSFNGGFGIQIESGETITIDESKYNGKVLCVRAKSDIATYQASEVISGIDSNMPVIKSITSSELADGYINISDENAGFTINAVVEEDNIDSVEFVIQALNASKYYDSSGGVIKDSFVKNTIRTQSSDNTYSTTFSDISDSLFDGEVSVSVKVTDAVGNVTTSDYIDHLNLGGINNQVLGVGSVSNITLDTISPVEIIFNDRAISLANSVFSPFFSRDSFIVSVSGSGCGIVSVISDLTSQSLQRTSGYIRLDNLTANTSRICSITTTDPAGNITVSNNQEVLTEERLDFSGYVFLDANNASNVFIPNVRMSFENVFNYVGDRVVSNFISQEGVTVSGYQWKNAETSDAILLNNISGETSGSYIIRDVDIYKWLFVEITYQIGNVSYTAVEPIGLVYPSKPSVVRNIVTTATSNSITVNWDAPSTSDVNGSVDRYLVHFFEGNSADGRKIHTIEVEQEEIDAGIYNSDTSDVSLTVSNNSIEEIFPLTQYFVGIEAVSVNYISLEGASIETLYSLSSDLAGSAIKTIAVENEAPDILFSVIAPSAEYNKKFLKVYIEDDSESVAVHYVNTTDVCDSTQFNSSFTEITSSDAITITDNNVYVCVRANDGVNVVYEKSEQITGINSSATLDMPISLLLFDSGASQSDLITNDGRIEIYDRPENADLQYQILLDNQTTPTEQWVDAAGNIVPEPEADGIYTTFIRYRFTDGTFSSHSSIVFTFDTTASNAIFEEPSENIIYPAEDGSQTGVSGEARTQAEDPTLISTDIRYRITIRYTEDIVKVVVLGKCADLRHRTQRVRNQGVQPEEVFWEVFFAELPEGSFTDCVIRLIDSSGNIFDRLITPFYSVRQFDIIQEISPFPPITNLEHPIAIIQNTKNIRARGLTLVATPINPMNNCYGDGTDLSRGLYTGPISSPIDQWETSFSLDNDSPAFVTFGNIPEGEYTYCILSSFALDGNAFQYQAPYLQFSPFVIDRTITLPTVTLINDTGRIEKVTKNGAINLSNIQDGETVFYQIKLDGNPAVQADYIQAPLTGNIFSPRGNSGYEDGDYVLYTRSEDAAGNIAETDEDNSFAFTIDTTSPEQPNLSIVGVNPPDILINNTDAANGIEISGASNGATYVTITIREKNSNGDIIKTESIDVDTTNNADYSYTFPLEKITQTSGRLDVVVAGKDDAGNVSPSFSFIGIKFDFEGVFGTLSLVLDTGGEQYNNDKITNDGRVQISIDRTNTNSITYTVEKQNIDGVTYTEVVPSSTLPADNIVPSPIADGVYRIMVAITDLDGNTENQSFEYTLDVTSPTFTLDSVSGVLNDIFFANRYFVNKETLQNQDVVFSGVFGAQDTSLMESPEVSALFFVEGISEEIGVSISGDRWTATLNKERISALPDGSYQVAFSLSDIAGNETLISQTDNNEIIKDVTPPGATSVVVNNAVDGILTPSEYSNGLIVGGTISGDVNQHRVGVIISDGVTSISQYVRFLTPSADWTIVFDQSDVSMLRLYTPIDVSVIIYDPASNSTSILKEGLFTIQNDEVTTETLSLSPLSPTTGDTVTATLSGNPTNITYEWIRDNVIIGTSQTYVITEDELGQEIHARAFYMKDGNSVIATAVLDVPSTVSSAPQDLQLVENTSGDIVATWNPPTQTGGEYVYGYLFSISTASVSTIDEANASSSSNTEYTFDAGTHNIVPGTEYFVQVSALNAIGTSPLVEKSIQVVLNTNTLGTLSLSPSNLNVGTQVIASLSDPDNPRNIVYQWFSNLERLATITNSYIIKQTDGGKTLSAFVVYEDDFQTNNFAAIEVNIPQFAPSIPTQVTPLQKNTNDILLGWFPPEYNGGSEITGYAVNIKEKNDTYENEDIVFEGNEYWTYTFSQLTQGIEYTIRIASINTIGQSEYVEIDATTSSIEKPNLSLLHDTGRSDIDRLTYVPIILVSHPNQFDGGTYQFRREEETNFSNEQPFVENIFELENEDGTKLTDGIFIVKASISITGNTIESDEYVFALDISTPDIIVGPGEPDIPIIVDPVDPFPTYISIDITGNQRCDTLSVQLLQREDLSENTQEILFNITGPTGRYTGCKLLLTDTAGTTSEIPLAPFDINNPSNPGGGGSGGGGRGGGGGRSGPGGGHGGVLIEDTEKGPSLNEKEELDLLDPKFLYVNAINKEVMQLKEFLGVQPKTGSYNVDTISAVKVFQKNHNIPETGIIFYQQTDITDIKTIGYLNVWITLYYIKTKLEKIIKELQQKKYSIEQTETKEKQNTKQTYQAGEYQAPILEI